MLQEQSNYNTTWATRCLSKRSANCFQTLCQLAAGEAWWAEKQADLQRQVKKDIRDAARRRKAAKSATATAPQTHASRAVHMRLWSTVVVCGSTTANTWCLIFNNCVRVCARFTQCFTERSCSQGHLFCSTFTLNAVTQLGAVLALYFSRCFFITQCSLNARTIN